MSTEVRIAVASAMLGAGFAGSIYAQLKKLLKPGEAVVESAVFNLQREIIRSRVMALLDGEPRPIALIGICLRFDPPELEAFRATGTPVILVDEQAEGASTVACDNFAGGYMAGQHLARSGRKSIAVVAGDLRRNGNYNAVQRVDGFAKACAEHRLRFARQEIIEVNFYTQKDGVNAMNQLLDERRNVDAVFCAAGDATATGMLAVARERGIKVPEQLAVVGYDDSPMAAIATPPLSSIHQSAEQLAAEAYKLATERRAECLERPQTVLLAPKLVLRRSA